MSNIVFNGKEKTNKSSAERKPRKPNYNENAILQEQKDDAVHLYNSDMSLQAIADELSQPNQSPKAPDYSWSV